MTRTCSAQTVDSLDSGGVLDTVVLRGETKHSFDSSNDTPIRRRVARPTVLPPVGNSHQLEAWSREQVSLARCGCLKTSSSLAYATAHRFPLSASAHRRCGKGAAWRVGTTRRREVCEHGGSHFNRHGILHTFRQHLSGVRSHEAHNLMEWERTGRLYVRAAVQQARGASNKIGLPSYLRLPRVRSD